MSAYIVSKEHIDTLVYAAKVYTRQFGLRWKSGAYFKTYQNGVVETNQWNKDKLAWNPIEINEEGENTLGALLWSENHQSVAERYPDDKEGEWPGPTGLTTIDVLAYTYREPRTMIKLTVVQLLKFVSCYEYQSCEHSEWEQSEAKEICDALRTALIHALPGYEEAKWEL